MGVGEITAFLGEKDTRSSRVFRASSVRCLHPLRFHQTLAHQVEMPPDVSKRPPQAKVSCIHDIWS